MEIKKYCIPKEEYNIPLVNEGIQEGRKLVYCKDCKWWRKDWVPKRGLADDTGHSACMRLNGIILMDADDFCSRGERKDE